MFWKEKNLKYDILIPPLGKPYEKLNATEAKDYFNWYISRIEERTQYLSDFSGIELNYSTNSLVVIWGWFLKNAEIEKTPSAKLDAIKKQLVDSPFLHVVLAESKEQFSLETEYIMRDIAMYYGNVFVKNHKSLYWGYYTDTKKDSFANIPLVMGFEDRDFEPPFKASFDPNGTIESCALNILDRTQRKVDLFNAYQKKLRMVHD
jgi:hypothetical protein